MEEMILKEKGLESQLKNSEEKYALALEGADAGIWDWDIIKNQITYSPRFYSLLGYENKEISSTIEAFKELLHPEDVEKTFSLIDQCLNDHKKYSIEYRLKNKDNSFKWYLSSGITKYNQEDKPTRMVGSIIDINDKKIISQSYMEKVAELEKSNKLMVNREIKMAEIKEQMEKIKEENKCN